VSEPIAGDEREYDAIVLDLDGTLVDDGGRIRPRVLESLHRIREAGVRVMVATGRSEGGTVDVLEELGTSMPAIVFNGAGLYCPLEERLLEERVLSDRAVQRVLDHARREDLFFIAMRYGEKFAIEPRTQVEERALHFLEDLAIVAPDAIPTERLMRITLFSDRHGDSERFGNELDAAVGLPLYFTWFPLNALAHQRESPLVVADVQPPCRGKGEALRVLREDFGIPSSRVVCVGDADNDVPMLVEAGLAVAMGNAMPSALSVAQRVIGDNNGDAIADLVDELFPGSRAASA